MRVLAIAAVTFGWSASAGASGHGPLFSLATPTLPESAVELDACVMTHVGDRATSAMLAAMVAYGITPNLQVGLTAPMHVHELDDSLPPLLRGAAMMPGDGSIEADAAWRFLHLQPGVAQRIEATALVGAGISPLDSRPRALGAVAVGVITRTFDLWGSGGYDGPDRGPLWSGTAGVRLMRQVVDLRLFGEVVGDHQTVAAGPSILVLEGAFTVSAGMLMPLGSGASQPLRIAVNVGTYLF